MRKKRKLKKLRRWWRRLEGDVELTNDILPLSLLAEMEGSCPPDHFVSNGSSFSPDKVLGADLRPAAHFHDFAYGYVVRNETERCDADFAFYRNLGKCGLGAFLARKYFFRVRFWGALACSYCGFEGNRPKGWQWYKILITRYFSW